MENERQGRWAVDGVAGLTDEEGVLANLRHMLQLLAASAQEQIAHYAPVELAAVAAEEMAQDFANWAEAVPTYWTLTEEQMARLQMVQAALDHLATSGDEADWSNAALRNDPRWEEVRTLAQAALTSFKWTTEVPPPAHYSD
jgi:hypothetical protein